MISTMPDPERIVRREKDIYNTRLRPEIEPGNKGKYVVINVETGDDALGGDVPDLADRLQAQQPDAPLDSMRIGFPYTDRLGRRAGTDAR
jgi:hypothetical protein